MSVCQSVFLSVPIRCFGCFRSVWGIWDTIGTVSPKSIRICSKTKIKRSQNKWDIKNFAKTSFLYCFCSILTFLPSKPCIGAKDLKCELVCPGIYLFEWPNTLKQEAKGLPSGQRRLIPTEAATLSWTTWNSIMIKCTSCFTCLAKLFSPIYIQLPLSLRLILFQPQVFRATSNQNLKLYIVTFSSMRLYHPNL